MEDDICMCLSMISPHINRVIDRDQQHSLHWVVGSCKYRLSWGWTVL